MTDTLHERLYRPGLWPVLIVEDRYGGAYSDGEWLAIADAHTLADGERTRLDVVEAGAWDGDCECMAFWADLGDVWWIGKGATPDAALADLNRRCDMKDGCLPVRAKNGIPL